MLLCALSSFAQQSFSHGMKQVRWPVQSPRGSEWWSQAHQHFGWKFSDFPLHYIASDSLFYGILQFIKPLHILEFLLSFTTTQCDRWSKNCLPHVTDDKPNLRKKICPHGNKCQSVSNLISVSRPSTLPCAFSSYLSLSLLLIFAYNWCPAHWFVDWLIFKCIL